MVRAARLLQAVVFFVNGTTLVKAACYAPNGREITTSDIAPCSNDASDPLSHVCCNLNRPKAPGTSTNASEIRDTCLPNGLCQNESLLKDGSVYLQWGRNFCTNRDWSTGQCLDDVCTSTADDRGGSKRLIPCSGKNSSLTWCCGDSDDCCTSTDQTDLVSLSPTFTIAVVTSTSSASSGTSTAAETTSASKTASNIATTGSSEEQIPTSATAQTPTGTSATAVASPSSTATLQTPTLESSGLSRGSKAGIAIGAVVGAVILVMLGVWISKALAWRRDAHAARAQNNTTGSDLEGLYGQHPQKYAYYAEADATTPPVEALATPDPVEAPDTQVNFRHSRLGGFYAAKPQ